MQNLRSSILSYMRVGIPTKGPFVPQGRNGRSLLRRACNPAASIDRDQIMDRVIQLVKKFDKIDSDKVTESADFQKDLSLDSPVRKSQRLLDCFSQVPCDTVACRTPFS